MTKEKMISILMEDGCTEHDAERHLADGTVIFENPEEYIDTLKGCGSYDGETVEDARNGKLADVSMVTVDGHEYLIVYAL